MNEPMQRLFAMIEGWGGKLERVNYVTYAEFVRARPLSFAPAPFTSADFGIFWKDKLFVYTDRVAIRPSELIHEMGHVFACLTPPRDLDTEEVDFLGWEYVLACAVGVDPVVWRRDNDQYMVTLPQSDGPVEMQALNDSEFAILMADRVFAAEKFGTIINGLPVAIR